MNSMRSAANLLVECLQAEQVERVFCVPGESYLAVLDALVDQSIEVVTCRQESGAAMMAEADGKMTGRPGVVMVTRGPGACNAAAGIHIAQQDSTPLVMFVGQIGLDFDGRDAFQEVDFRHMYGQMAKWVTEIHRPERIPEVVAHAWSVAMNGRPGPVVIALPEDMLTQAVKAQAGQMTIASRPAPAPRDIDRLGELLRGARNPIAIVGGSGWDEQIVRGFEDFAAAWDLPVACSFRRQMLFNHDHPCYAGDLGLGANPQLVKRIKDADLVLLMGGRLSEIPSQGYSLLNIPGPNPQLVHVHADAHELGRVYQAGLLINASPDQFVVAAPRGELEPSDRTRLAHEQYVHWSTPTGKVPGELQMHQVVAHLEKVLPQDVMICNGAGNYTVWMQRFHRYRRFGTQLAPVSGSMGYGLPAAISAKLRFPERFVLCMVGDGCYHMTSQEFSTAVQFGANILVIVIDNGMYGTIRAHQEREYPGRVSATFLRNPDFAKIAEASGGYGESVTRTDEFPAAFDRAVEAGVPALLHLKLHPSAITPDRSLEDIRGY